MSAGIPVSQPRWAVSSALNQRPDNKAKAAKGELSWRNRALPSWVRDDGPLVLSPNRRIAMLMPSKTSTTPLTIRADGRSKRTVPKAQCAAMIRNMPLEVD